MTATITHIDTARQRRECTSLPANVIRIEHAAEHITRNQKAMDRLLQDLNLGWYHACSIVDALGYLTHGDKCPWCSKGDPNSPDDAA